jgi:glycosyltransferase involved in cell wall biosynthesis
MRVLYLSIGRGAAYYGSCVHDNAVAAELRRRGATVDFHSVFTRLVSDEPRVARRRVFFSGVSLLLQSQAPPFRWVHKAFDRLWDNRFTMDVCARRFSELEPSKWAHMEPGSTRLDLVGSVLVSALRGRDGEMVKEVHRLLEAFRRHKPDVVVLSHGFLLGLAGPLKERFGCPIIVALQDELTLLSALDKQYSFEALELMRGHLAHADVVVARRQGMTKRLTEWFALPASRMHVVLPSINVRGFAPPARARNSVFTVGYFGRIAPEKGVHLLCDSYVRLREQGQLPAGRFELGGVLVPSHESYLEVMRQRMRNAGLEREFAYRGSLDRAGKYEFLSTLDVFSMPAVSEDELGLPVLEAMSAGVPVVQPRRGVFPELIERTGGGIVVSPSDEDALTEGLLTLYQDPALARDLGRRGAAGVRAHFSVEREGDELARLIESVCRPPAVEPSAEPIQPSDAAAAVSDASRAA